MTTAYCFDLDGTVTTREVLPAISSELGIVEEMGLLTDLTVSGTIPFDMSFRLRCLILRSIPVSRVQGITAQIGLHADILSFLRANRDRCFLLTGNVSDWVAPLIEQCGCRAFTSEADRDGEQIGMLRRVLHKGEAARSIRGDFDRIVAIGDGANDAMMFEESDVSIAFGGVHDPAPSLLKLANYAVYDGGALCRLLNTL